MICSKHLPGGWKKPFIFDDIKNKEDARKIIKSACEESLKELNVDCIDLYYLHRLYPEHTNITVEDTMEVFKGKHIDNLSTNIFQPQTYNKHPKEQQT